MTVFHPMCGTLRSPCGVNRTHAPRQQPEPFATLPLLAPLEEQLMSKAHTEHRGAGTSKPAHRVTKPGIAQCARGDCERAHPGEHNAVAARDRARVAADHRLRSGHLERSLDAAHVADAVVTHADRGDHSVPFVDGTPPPITRNASRLARPNALKAASAM